MERREAHHVLHAERGRGRREGKGRGRGERIKGRAARSILSCSVKETTDLCYLGTAAAAGAAHGACDVSRGVGLGRRCADAKAACRRCAEAKADCRRCADARAARRRARRAHLLSCGHMLGFLFGRRLRCLRAESERGGVERLVAHHDLHAEGGRGREGGRGEGRTRPPTLPPCVLRLPVGPGGGGLFPSRED